MRVCHVITEPELGGAQLSTFSILQNLPKDKYEISFITSPRGILLPDFKGLKGIRLHFCPSLVRSISPISDIYAFIYIYNIYRRYNYDIVHTHSSKAGIIGRWAARFAGTPVIIHTVHGWPFHDYQPVILRSFYIFLERVTARFTTKIICVSKKDLQSAVKHRIAPAEKLVFIKYGIPLAEFRRPSTDILKKRLGLGITNSDPVIGMISCLKPQKSPLDYIKASIKIYEKRPDINFLLIGDGALRAKCERLLRGSPLNGRFIFTGWRRDILEILDVVDVVVLTSKWEGMPIAIIEALSKGCPVVATNAGGTQELIKDGVTGYLVRTGSHEDVAEGVLKMLGDSQSFENMKRAAFLSIDDSFKLDRMVSQVDGLYNRELGKA